jgi:hypothetical protein
MAFPAELRAHERRAAKELGKRLQKHEENACTGEG